jgi:hypothetical protein
MGKKAPTSRRSAANQVECEYCERVGDHSQSSNCEGCGAPLPLKSKEQERFEQWQPAIMYDPALLDAAQLQQMGPRQNIPINLNHFGGVRLADLISGAGYVFPIKR